MKAARSCVVATVAVLGLLALAVPAAAEHHAGACTAEYHAALTDEYYLYYADYPYSWYAREQTIDYLACLRG